MADRKSDSMAKALTMVREPVGRRNLARYRIGVEVMRPSIMVWNNAMISINLRMDDGFRAPVQPANFEGDCVCALAQPEMRGARALRTI